MLLYKCRFTGDEMLSDAFGPRDVVDDDGNVVEGLLEIDSMKVNKVCHPLTTVAPAHEMMGLHSTLHMMIFSDKETHHRFAI